MVFGIYTLAHTLRLTKCIMKKMATWQSKNVVKEHLELMWYFFAAFIVRILPTQITSDSFVFCWVWCECACVCLCMCVLEGRGLQTWIRFRTMLNMFYSYKKELEGQTCWVQHTCWSVTEDSGWCLWKEAWHCFWRALLMPLMSDFQNKVDAVTQAWHSYRLPSTANL